MGERDELLKKDASKCIKQILSEVEIAARMQPVDACHPYKQEERRKVIINAIWDLYRRVVAAYTKTPDAPDA